jgi:sugar phosphate isomerase/epimerase
LQWLRSADEVADAAAEMGYDGVDVTVRPYPGHVDPARVGQELPGFVKALRKRGLQVVEITTNIADAESPYAEARI